MAAEVVDLTGGDEMGELQQAMQKGRVSERFGARGLRRAPTPLRVSRAPQPSGDCWGESEAAGESDDAEDVELVGEHVGEASLRVATSPLADTAARTSFAARVLRKRLLSRSLPKAAQNAAGLQHVPQGPPTGRAQRRAARALQRSGRAGRRGRPAAPATRAPRGTDGRAREGGQGSMGSSEESPCGQAIDNNARQPRASAPEATGAATTACPPLETAAAAGWWSEGEEEDDVVLLDSPAGTSGTGGRRRVGGGVAHGSGAGKAATRAAAPGSKRKQQYRELHGMSIQQRRAVMHQWKTHFDALAAPAPHPHGDSRQLRPRQPPLEAFLDARGGAGGLGIFLDGGFVSMTAAQCNALFPARDASMRAQDLASPGVERQIHGGAWVPPTGAANAWELFTFCVLLDTFPDVLARRTVVVYTDNEAARMCVESVQRLPDSPVLAHLARVFLGQCFRLEVRVEARRVEGVCNVLADALSRQQWVRFEEHMQQWVQQRSWPRSPFLHGLGQRGGKAAS